MAIFHMSVRIVSRIRGLPIVAKAAYRSATKLRDQRLRETYNYSRRDGVEHVEILAPDCAPDWVYDRERLWNAADEAERWCNAQTAREVMIALPRELSKEQQLALVRRFAAEVFVACGMIADFSIHRKSEENPTACILLTMRRIAPTGFHRLKNHEWSNRSLVGVWRESWCVHCNAALKSAGLDVRVDHRSHAEQGIGLEPTRRLGVPTAVLFDPEHQRARVDTRDSTREAIAAQREVMERNAGRVLTDPKAVVSVMAKSIGDIGEEEMTKWLRTRVASHRLAECVRACLEIV